MPHAHVVAAGENTGFHFLEIAMRPVVEKKIHSATRRNIVFRDVVKEEKPILPIPTPCPFAIFFQLMKTNGKSGDIIKTPFYGRQWLLRLNSMHHTGDMKTGDQVIKYINTRKIHSRHIISQPFTKQAEKTGSAAYIQQTLFSGRKEGRKEGRKSQSIDTAQIDGKVSLKIRILCI